MFKFDKTTLLLVVDPQLDFMPKGALPVTDGDKIIPYINALQTEILNNGGMVAYTKDFHPHNHSSFKEQGGPWPSHCVKKTEGSQFHPELDASHGETFYKGFDVDVDSYSGFGGVQFDVYPSPLGYNGYVFVPERQNTLDSYLKKFGIKKVVVVGLAFDVCVKATALDAVKLGYMTMVDMDGTKAVFPENNEKTIQELVDNYVMVLE